MNEIAESLGVGATALYRLFDSREAIAAECLNQISQEVQYPEPETDWRTALLMMSDEGWRICEKYRGLDRLLFTMPASVKVLDRVIQKYAEPLLRTGKTYGQILFAIDLVGGVTVSSHVGMSTMTRPTNNSARGIDQLMSLTDEKQFAQPDENWANKTFLTTKVEFILDALEHNWPEIPTYRGEKSTHK